MAFGSQRWLSGGMLLLMVFLTSIFWYQAQAQSTPGMSVNVVTAVPDLGIAAVGANGLEVTWDWDFISPGHVPTQVTQVDVEISDDGVNFGNLQNHAPTDFVASYPSLAEGTYTARVTIIDGNDFSYTVGPVVISSVGSRLNRPGGGAPGLMGDEGEAAAEIRLEGLAYPGPSNQVTITIGDFYSTSVSPDEEGRFQVDVDSLPPGVLDFFVQARDVEGQQSSPLSRSETVAEGLDTTVTDLNLAPTIRIEREKVVRGEPVQLHGYAYPNGVIQLELYLEEELVEIQEVPVDRQGRWNYDWDSSLLEEGFYGVRARSRNSDGSVLSPEAEELVFELLGAYPSAAICGDGLLMEGEQCDDGNLESGDGCSEFCQDESLLPEGIVPLPGTEEEEEEGGMQIDFEGIVLMARPEARPEDRLSVAGELLFFAEGEFAPLYDFEVRVNDEGVAYLDIQQEVESGVYTLVFKGEAHLSRRLEGVSIVRQGTITLDFTRGGREELVAGDVHYSKDDFINVMDIMTVLNDLYLREDLLTDLNADGEVNAIDLAIMGVNLYKGGDRLY